MNKSNTMQNLRTNLLAFALGLALVPAAWAQSSSDKPYLINGSTTTQPLKELTDVALKSTVQVKSADGTWVATGIVINKKGFVITKASEISDAAMLTIRTSDGKAYRAAVLARNEENDIALLETEAETLTPIEWADDSEYMDIGRFVITPRNDGSLIGVVSARPRTIQLEGGVMGITMAATNDNSGVRIDMVTPDSGADAAGIKVGDILIEVEGEQTPDMEATRAAITKFAPGYIVEAKVIREGQIIEMQVTLGRRDEIGEATRSNARLSGPTSRRQTGFPYVMQHHIPILPRDCGGPLLNLSGKAVGVNIARVNRSETFALPATVVKEVTDALLKEVDDAFKAVNQEGVKTEPVSQSD